MLLHDNCAIYDTHPTRLVYAIYHIKLAVAISCKGQDASRHKHDWTTTAGANSLRRESYERAISGVTSRLVEALSFNIPLATNNRRIQNCTRGGVRIISG